MNVKKKQKIVKKWFIELQNLICDNIEDFEKEYGSKKNLKRINGSMENIERLKVK